MSLLPVDLITDMNNDGVINGVDSGLASAALEEGASDEVKEKGTEYVFVNDDLSNGLGDVEDKKAPAGTTDDDDIQEIKVSLDADFGTVNFDHPAIDKLRFFEDKPEWHCVKRVFGWTADLSRPRYPIKTAKISKFSIN